MRLSRRLYHRYINNIKCNIYFFIRLNAFGHIIVTEKENGFLVPKGFHSCTPTDIHIHRFKFDIRVYHFYLKQYTENIKYTVNVEYIALPQVLKVLVILKVKIHFYSFSYERKVKKLLEYLPIYVS